MSSQKIYEASTLLSSMNGRIKDYQNLKEQLEELKAAFLEIVQLSDFKGKAADAIKGFYHAQVDVVNAWEDFLEQHIQFLKSVEGSVTDRNLSGNTLVHVPFLEETLKKAAQRSNEIVSAKEGELKRIFRNIDDIISLKVFSSEEFDNLMYMAEKERKDTLDKVHELDYYLVNEYQKSQPAESYTKLLFQQLLESSRKDGSISPINFNSKAYHNSEIYRVKKHRFLSKEEFESINHKLAYKTQIIDEHEEFGGDYYVFDNGLIVRKFTARMDGKFVTRYEIVTKIPGKDRTGGVKELDSFLEGTPLEILEYLDIKHSVAKVGKKLLGNSLKGLEERLTIKVEKNQLGHAGAYNSYVESNLKIEKSVDPIKIEKKAAGERKPIVNKQIQEERDTGETDKISGKPSKGINNDIENTVKVNYSDIRAYRDIDIEIIPIEYRADPRLISEMDYKGKTKSGTNAVGWERSAAKHFNELLDKHPEFFSEANVERIENGLVTVVDDDFIKHFPQYKDCKGDKLIHHHIGGGGQAAAIPQSFHKGFGGVHNFEKEYNIRGNDPLTEIGEVFTSEKKP